MKGQLTDELRLQHILAAINEVEKYLTNVSFETFLDNSEKRFATIKQIEIVGEACNHITNKLKLAHPEIEWVQINGFRNISIHEYFGLDLYMVWEIAKNDLPFLKINFIQLLLEVQGK